MSIPESIVLGVVAGVITSFLLFIIKITIDKIILPWYLECIYKGVDIDGKWETEDKKIKINLSQKAHQIKGTMTINEKEFSLIGSIWEGYLKLDMTSTNKKRLSFTNALLKISGQGDTFTGFFTYKNLISDQVSSKAIILNRAG